MRKQLSGVAIAAALWTAPSAAVNTEQYEVPYFGLIGEALLTDTARDAKNGAGLQLLLGVPMRNPAAAIELRFFDAGYERADSKDNFQSGLFVDYVRDFGPVGGSDAWYGGIKPFAVAGIGFVQEDVNADKHLHLGLSLGAGMIVPIAWNGWAVRLDARAQPQANSDSVPDRDYLLDYAVNLGIQMPMTWFYDRPISVEAAECPLAVVDPDTGRRDCVTDSDGDGVADSRDRCPGTDIGVAVNTKGCIKARKHGDAD